MSINDSDIKNLIKLHNTMLENASSVEFPYKQIAERRIKKPNRSAGDSVAVRIRKLALVYFTLSLVFVFLSLAIINSIERKGNSLIAKELKVELFNPDHKGGIVYAFNRVIK